MTLKELKKEIKKIKVCAHDDESAHSSEDRLRHAVLEEIARGNKNGRELAKEVLKTSDIDFARWCA
jgi:hypothetical protein